MCNCLLNFRLSSINETHKVNKVLLKIYKYLKKFNKKISHKIKLGTCRKNVGFGLGVTLLRWACIWIEIVDWAFLGRRSFLSFFFFFEFSFDESLTFSFKYFFFIFLIELLEDKFGTWFLQK